MEWGIYSGAKGKTIVPLRAYEIVLVLILWGVFFFMKKKDKFKYKGQCAALGTVGFGVIVFVFDILCTSPDARILFLSAVGVSALMTVAMGCLMIFVFKKKSQQLKKCCKKSNKK